MQCLHTINDIYVQYTMQGGISSQKISINLDNPEGGSDGMLQVAVCSDVSVTLTVYTV